MFPPVFADDVVPCDGAAGNAALPTDTEPAADLPRLHSCNGVILAAAGALRVRTRRGNVRTITGLAVGVPIALRLRHIFATGTTVAGASIQLLRS